MDGSLHTPLPRPAARPLARLKASPEAVAALTDQGLGQRLARLAANRGMDIERLWPTDDRVADPRLLPDIDAAVNRIVRAIAQEEVIVGCMDHDADGVTSGAVLWGALVDLFGVAPERVHLLTSHKLKEGYGLSDAVVDRVLSLNPMPTLCITADQGSCDAPRIARLRAAGIDTVVTDHHGMPPDGPPAEAVATVNPARTDGQFADPTIAGVGVMWLVLSMVRAALVRSGQLPADAPKLRSLLDYVAVGTVADAVSLAGATNRWFVQQGMALIETGSRPCWRVLPTVREAQTKGGLGARDIAFGIGPLINAQGRMDDAREGIVFLLADGDEVAESMLGQLQANNEARKQMERGLTATALDLAAAEVDNNAAGLTLFLAEGSPAVQGIVASRVVDRFHRPTICLSPSPSNRTLLSGSVRSVPGFHVRDALQAIEDADPGLLAGFGGHAAAAGLTVAVERWTRLAKAWDDQVARAKLSSSPAHQIDGQLAQPPDTTLLAQLHTLEPWGRGFEEPVFDARVEVLKVNVYQDRHLALTVAWGQNEPSVRAMWFDGAKRAIAGATGITVGAKIHLVCKIVPNVFRDRLSCELSIVDILQVDQTRDRTDRRQPWSSSHAPPCAPLASSGRSKPPW